MTNCVNQSLSTSLLLSSLVVQCQKQVHFLGNKTQLLWNLGNTWCSLGFVRLPWVLFLISMWNGATYLNYFGYLFYVFIQHKIFINSRHFLKFCGRGQVPLCRLWIRDRLTKSQREVPKCFASCFLFTLGGGGRSVTRQCYHSQAPSVRHIQLDDRPADEVQ